MIKTIAFANHKGGVGKTTSVVNIGAALAQAGKRVLLIDLDAQQNLTYSLLHTDEVEVSVYDAMLGRADLPISKVKEGLYVVPASIDLARAEIDLNSQISREYILKSLLDRQAGNYDFILLDCPPSLGVVTSNALTAATDLYIPLIAEALPLKGLTMLEEVVGLIRERVNGALSLSGVFLTRYNNRTLNAVVSDRIAALYGDRLFKTRIRENIALAEAPLSGMDIFSYAPNSNGAKDYKALTEEIIQRTQN